MKKLVSMTMLGCFFVLCFSGCTAGAKTYKEASEAFENGQYSKVVELLDSIPEYKDSNNFREQADAFVAFEEAANVAETKNKELDTAIEEAETQLNSGSIPYVETVATDLQLAISNAREAKEVVPKMPEGYIDVIAETDRIVGSYDYSNQLAALDEALHAFKTSVQQMLQVTNPTGDSIILRISEIEGIENIQGVTEDNDPNGNLNKQGGYSSSTYFTSPFVEKDVSGVDTVDKGTDAGGCIEVYETVEDAVKRNDYLATFDGPGILNSGSHVVCGTIVVRTSQHLTGTKQKEMTAQIVEKLIEVKE